ncbi:hypothetical protein HY411_01650 [Candidatus Gottesmanbacteria bacterium]|nr:hypothetical protein [Candidatus Gottesmanbacteria bacterium]
MIATKGKSTPLTSLSDIEIAGGGQTFWQWLSGSINITLVSKGGDKDTATIATRTGFEWLLWVFRLRQTVKTFAKLRESILTAAKAATSGGDLKSRATQIIALEEEVVRQRAEKAAQKQQGGQDK